MVVFFFFLTFSTSCHFFLFCQHTVILSHTHNDGFNNSRNTVPWWDLGEEGRGGRICFLGLARALYFPFLFFFSILFFGAVFSLSSLCFFFQLVRRAIKEREKKTITFSSASLDHGLAAPPLCRGGSFGRGWGHASEEQEEEVSASQTRRE